MRCPFFIVLTATTNFVCGVFFFIILLFMHKKHFLIFFLILSTWLLVVFCNSEKKTADEHLPFLNINDTVKYVGMQACRRCHENVYQSFIHTGMGQSFDTASPHKSSAKFDEHSLVYDSINNLFYKPYWQDSNLFIMEYRLSGKDTIHKRVEQVKYIIGSGQHTNSHLWEINGYIHQAPITFYTQNGKWDLAPGFENGASSGFNRIIGVECMSCHNGLPGFEYGSENKYLKVKDGIDCERCHGAGEIHVREKLAGNIVDTSKYTDFTIVNPANLPVDLQMNLCQRCHLQGISVLNEGKTFHDFRPGMKISEVFNVFLPRYEGDDENFIMASQADRLRMSKCFIHSRNEEKGKTGMSCITCHNPHISVKVTPKEHFNNACKNCHSQQNACTAPMNLRMEKEDNCFSCHMPKSGSMDIPHVRITDHFIRKPIAEEEKNNIEKFIGLACLTKENPSSLLQAKGYITFFESFSSRPEYLDSAEKYLNKNINDTSLENFKTQIHLHYLKNDYNKVISFSGKYDVERINDGWTYYRIGEAFYQKQKNLDGYKYFKKAVEMKPYNLEFLNKLGSSYLTLNEIQKAKEVFENILQENPKYVVAWSNLGFVELNMGNLELADECYNHALALDPDYEMALMNKVGLFIVRKQNKEAKKLLQDILKKNPKNERAKYILANL